MGHYVCTQHKRPGIYRVFCYISYEGGDSECFNYLYSIYLENVSKVCRIHKIKLIFLKKE